MNSAILILVVQALLLIGLAVVIFFQTYIRHSLELEVTEAQTIKANRLKGNLSILLYVGGAISVVLAIISPFTNSAAQGKLQHSIEQLNQSVDGLMGMIATNPAIDVNIREDILKKKQAYEVGEMSPDNLNGYISAWSNEIIQSGIDVDKEKKASSEQQRAIVEPTLPLYNYTIQSLQTRLATVNHGKNCKVVSNYTTLPSLETLCPGETRDVGYQDRVFPVCIISLQTNCEWACECSIKIPERMNWNERMPQLILHCKGKGPPSELIVGRTQDRVYICTRLPAMRVNDNYYPLAESNARIDDALRVLIGSQAEAFEN